MSITGTDLRTPAGELTVELLTALVSDVPNAATPGDVAAAYAIVGSTHTSAWTANADAGGILWGMAQAMRARAQQILTSASSLSSDGDARAYSSTQAVELQKRAAELESMAEALEVTVTDFVPPLSSRAVPITFAW